MSTHRSRFLAALVGAVLLGSAAPAAVAQSSGEPKGPDQGKPPGNQQPEPGKDDKKKIDEFAEAARLLTGPAANPECVWLGRRVVNLLWRDDLDTAFRHLDLYDRFGCPGGHIQATFRCLTRFGAEIDSKVPESLDRHVHACWINPGAQPQAAAAAQPAPPSTAGTAPATPAAAPSPAAAAPSAK